MNFSQATVRTIITHKVGNKQRGEGILLSNSLQNFDSELEATILEYFLGVFARKQNFMAFTHPSDLRLNEMYHYAGNLFNHADETSFIAISKDIARHLHNASTHPKIASGELIVVRFDGIVHNDETINAIGIFKSEHKEPFLKVIEGEGGIRFSKETGINLARIDKGCLILESRDGDHDVLIIDRDQNIRYWMDRFLGVAPRRSPEYDTKQVLSLCKAFGDEVLSLKYEPETKLDFLNGAIDYLEKHDVFDYDSFIHDEMLFNSPELREDFMRYGQEQAEQNPTAYAPFQVAHKGLDRERSRIKSSVHLDTGMIITFTGTNAQGTYYEKGFDRERGMHYYKLFYNGERD